MYLPNDIMQALTNVYVIIFKVILLQAVLHLSVRFLSIIFFFIIMQITTLYYTQEESKWCTTKT